MRRIFADALYWVALVHRKDQWHHAALKVSRTLSGCHLVTTDEVLTEMLATSCQAGPVLRQRAAALVRRLHQRPTLTIHPNRVPPSFPALPCTRPARTKATA